MFRTGMEHGFDTISLTIRDKAQCVPNEIEQVGLPKRTFIQLHHDQVALGRDLADGPSRLLPWLGVHDAGVR